MATLSDLRDYVRVQTETTAAELPNTTIDRYIREAFNRTISAENRWPFYETSWTLTQEIGSSALAIPATMNVTSIISLTDDQNDGFPLALYDYEAAEELNWRFPITGTARAYSIWDGYFYLWPAATHTTEQTFTARGYRKPTDWVTSGAATEVDADDLLHYPLAHYAVALAYAQQEDETLEDRYMMRWQRDVEMARQKIMVPTRSTPVRMGGGKLWDR